MRNLNNSICTYEKVDLYRNYPYPTVKIGDLLKKASFTYDGNGNWNKFYPKIDNLTFDFMEEQWAAAADGIMVTIIGSDKNVIDSFTI